MSEDELDITGIDHAVLLAALFNGTQPIGLGHLRPGSDESMTVEMARQILSQWKNPSHAEFDYVNGRPIKVKFRGNVLEWADLYDRDAGEGACRRIVERLRAEAKP